MARKPRGRHEASHSEYGSLKKRTGKKRRAARGARMDGNEEILRAVEELARDTHALMVLGIPPELAADFARRRVITDLVGRGLIEADIGR